MSNPRKALIYVDQLGCDDETNEPSIKILFSVAKSSGFETQYICNDSTFLQLADILKLYTMRSDLLISHKGVQKAQSTVQKYLDNNYIVILAGYSYGGMIVSHIAKHYEKQTINYPIYFITIGSIFIPKTKRVNIIHYLNTGDSVSLRLNRIDKNKPNSNIEWIPTPQEIQNKTFPKRNFFGRVFWNTRDALLHKYDRLTLILNYVILISENYENLIKLPKYKEYFKKFNATMLR